MALLRTLAVGLSVTLAVVVVLTAGITFFGGTKVGRLYEVRPTMAPDEPRRPDAGPPETAEQETPSRAPAPGTPTVEDAPR